MPVAQDRSRIAFQKLNRELTKLAARPIPENVHRFRTSGRRVETLLDELIEKPSRNDEKLGELLAQLRKKAGRVRDLDVQILSLRNLRIPEEPGRKTQLMRVLSEQHVRREKKLAKAFNKDTVRELRKRLKRAAAEIETPATTELLALAMRTFSQAAKANAPLTEDTLHRYRVAGKRARYLAELAGQDPAAERTVAQLKRMQDVIGDWHDWWKLTQQAENLFGKIQGSALVSVLRNVTRAKFRLAADSLSEAKKALGHKPILVDASPGRRQPAREGLAKITAAAS